MTLMRFAKCSILFGILVFVCLPPLRAQVATDKVVHAADKFLATLSEEQPHKVIYASAMSSSARVGPTFPPRWCYGAVST